VRFYFSWLANADIVFLPGEHRVEVLPGSDPILSSQLEPFLNPEPWEYRKELRRFPRDIIEHLENMLCGAILGTFPSQNQRREGLCWDCASSGSYASSGLREKYKCLSFNYGFLERCKACAKILSVIPAGMRNLRTVFDRTLSDMRSTGPDSEIPVEEGPAYNS
jgi:hypothetical protein